MENKKTDFNQIIGFTLLGALALIFMWTNKPTQEEIDAKKAEEKAKQEIVEKSEVKKVTNENVTLNNNISIVDTLTTTQDSLKAVDVVPNKLEIKTVENEVLKLDFSSKGGFLVDVELKKYLTFDKQKLHLIKDNNSALNITFNTKDNRVFNTKDLNFIPTITDNNGNQTISMKHKVSNNQFLEYIYTIKPNEYMIGFAIRSQGLQNVWNTNQPIKLTWNLDARRQEKSPTYENQNTALHYYTDDLECLGMAGDDSEKNTSVSWIGYKQHFFSSFLINKSKFEEVEFDQKTLVKDIETTSPFLKSYKSSTNIAINNGEVNENLQWYFGPNERNELKKYDLELEETINLGWGIFGWINKLIFVPVFGFLSKYIGSYGVLIILMTIVVRIFMSPLVYKSYLSSAKMKVIRPEMQAITAKYPDKKDAMKRQQETMALQRKTGVSMMSGCIPALLQMPIFFALFRFFPSEIGLRQKPFLWADDLSAYDNILDLPFNIPFYGNHVSLFPILASVAIFFYMKMSQSQQANMQMPTQEGMPDMQKMMKYMLYFSPLMMLVFFNNYASGLSLYYFISNLLTISIMFAIKKFLIDEDKIKAQIEVNKTKPKKESKFQSKLKKMMEEAEKQQKKSKK